MNKKIVLWAYISVLLFLTIIGFNHTLATESNLELKTDRDWYLLGEKVTLTLTNCGNETVYIRAGDSFMIISGPGEIVFMVSYWIPEPMPLLPGQSINCTWNQVNMNTGKQVPPGWYFAYHSRTLLFSVPFEIVAVIKVPRHCLTIQEAIKVAKPECTIYVSSGTYYEHVVVNKTVSLIGESRSTTIIDGNETFVTIVHVTANNVTIRGFTIQNDAPIHCLEGGGIYITNSNVNNIVDNVITNTQYPINLRNSAGNIIIGNTIIKNDVGIQFLDNHSSNNTIYHNNFINNGLQVSNLGASNIWDNGVEGNHWSDYNGTDFDEYGIGIAPYVIDANNQDNYPLMSPYIVADVNHDAKVDYKDLFILAATYGSTPDKPNWNPHADINEDDRVNFKDLFIAAANYGKKWR